MTGTANPDPTKLADDADADGWDVDKHGRMVDHATPDDTVTTEPYDGDR